MIKCRRYFRLAILFLIVNAVSLLSIMILGFITDITLKNIISYIIGISFWVSFFLTHIYFWLCDMKRRKINPNKNNLKTIGIFSFFQNLYAKIADIGLFVFTIALIILIVFRIDIFEITIPVLAIFYLLVNLHCFYNGRNFRFIQRRD